MAGLTLGVWLGALVVGLSLGLLGSGGSILTVPILVYGLGQPEKVAITGSLAIVGAIAAAGALLAARRRQVDGRSVVLFGGPGMVTAWLGSALSHQVSGATQLTVFALVMLTAAGFMFRGPLTARENPAPARGRWLPTVRDGAGVGLLTGFVGVGGGFLIVPALVLLGGLSVHLAVGTSLAIIALNAAAGFVEHLRGLQQAGLELDSTTLTVFTAVGIAGSWFGGHLASRLPQERLRKLFAVFLVLVAAFVLWENLGRGAV